VPIRKLSITTLQQEWLILSQSTVVNEVYKKEGDRAVQ
jgi:hypothetical protein